MVYTSFYIHCHGVSRAPATQTCRRTPHTGVLWYYNTIILLRVRQITRDFPMRYAVPVNSSSYQFSSTICSSYTPHCPDYCCCSFNTLISIFFAWQILPHCPKLADFRFSGTRSGREGSAAVVNVSAQGVRLAESEPVQLHTPSTARENKGTLGVHAS